MWDDFAARLATPAYALLWPEHPFFWAYLASACIIALGVCASRSGRRGLAALMAGARVVFDPKVLLHRSALTDYQFVLINHVVSVFELGAGILSAQAVAQNGADALSAAFGTPAMTPGWGASIAVTLAMVVAGDFANFYFHWLQHRIPALWELHKVHHSAEVLTPVTALRVHPIASILGAQFIALCMGVPGAVFLWAYGGNAAEYTVLGVNVLVFFWHLVLGNHLAHTHVWVMFPKGLREIFYSPALHLIHHSAHPRHHNKNLGFFLTIWDRFAGTLYQPADSERHDLVLGIEAEHMAELRTPWQLYWTPVRNLLSRRGPSDAAAEPTGQPAAH